MGDLGVACPNGAGSVRDQERDEADLLLTCPVERGTTHTDKRTHIHTVHQGKP